MGSVSIMIGGSPLHLNKQLGVSYGMIPHIHKRSHFISSDQTDPVYSNMMSFIVQNYFWVIFMLILYST